MPARHLLAAEGALPHDKRLHNADTYAIFAFENAFGRERVLKMFPLLR